MNYKFTAKKLGQHWYLDINHESPLDITLDEKIEKYFNLFKKDTVSFILYEIHSIVDNNTIFFEEEDIVRYLTTNDYFLIRFWIRDHEFSISSDMYYLLEGQSNMNFHKTMYTIEICNI